MERRAFLAATTAAAVTSADALATGAAAAEPGTAARPQVLELRRYRLRSGALASRFAAYAKDALVPALGRAGLAWGRGLHPPGLEGPHKREGDLGTGNYVSKGPMWSTGSFALSWACSARNAFCLRSQSAVSRSTAAACSACAWIAVSEQINASRR